MSARFAAKNCNIRLYGTLLCKRGDARQLEKSSQSQKSERCRIQRKVTFSTLETHGRHTPVAAIDTYHLAGPPGVRAPIGPHGLSRNHNQQTMCKVLRNTGWLAVFVNGARKNARWEPDHCGTTRYARRIAPDFLDTFQASGQRTKVRISFLRPRRAPLCAAKGHKLQGTQ